MKNNITKMIEDATRLDFGVIIDVTENEFDNGISSFNYIFDGVKYKHTSSHLNINIIVSDLMDNLSKENIECFKIKTQEYDKLRSITFEVFSEKFDHCSWTVGSTWFSPYHNTFEIEVILQGKKLYYVHIGSVETINHREIGNYFLNNYPEYSI